jgi:hypothetical protein
LSSPSANKSSNSQKHFLPNYHLAKHRPEIQKQCFDPRHPYWTPDEAEFLFMAGFKFYCKIIKDKIGIF